MICTCNKIFNVNETTLVSFHLVSETKQSIRNYVHLLPFLYLHESRFNICILTINDLINKIFYQNTKSFCFWKQHCISFIQIYFATSYTYETGYDKSCAKTQYTVYPFPSISCTSSLLHWHAHARIYLIFRASYIPPCKRYRFVPF